MSALLSPEAAPGRRPALRGVPRAAKPMSGLSFLLVLAAILGAGMLGLLMLNTQIQDQGFEVNELNAQAAANREEVAALNTQLNALSSSSELLRRATDLGMVPNAKPGFLDLRSGAVTGDPKPADQADVPRIKSDRTRMEEAARAKAEAEAKAKAEAEAKAKADAEAKAKADADAKAAAAGTPAPGAAAPATPAPAPSKKP